MSWSTNYTGVTVDEFKAKVAEYKEHVGSDPLHPDAETKARVLDQIDVGANACLAIAGTLKGSKFNFWLNGHANAKPGAGDSVGGGAGVSAY